MRLFRVHAAGLGTTRIKKMDRTGTLIRFVHLVSSLATHPFTSFSARMLFIVAWFNQREPGKYVFTVHKIFNSNRITNSPLNGIARDSYINAAR